MESALGVRDETMLTQKLLDFYGLPDVLTLREKWVKEEIEREKTLRLKWEAARLREIRSASDF